MVSYQLFQWSEIKMRVESSQPRDQSFLPLFWLLSVGMADTGVFSVDWKYSVMLKHLGWLSA